MVAVEVPLWVIHSNSSPASTPGGGQPGAGGPDLARDGGGGKKNRAADDAAGAGGGKNNDGNTDEHGPANLAAARALLTGHRLGRSAIYSVDAQPGPGGSRFATGGGDGRVRIWNSRALFHPPPAAPPPTGARRRKRRRAAGEEGRRPPVGSGGNAAGVATTDGGEEEDSNVSTAGPGDEGQAGGGGGGADGGAGAAAPAEAGAGGTSRGRRGGRFTRGGGYESSSSSGGGSSGGEAATANGAGDGGADDGRGGADPTPARPPPPPVRLLSSIASHEGSVLCCRWSHTGRYLASSGDDAHVLIYERRPGRAVAHFGDAADAADRAGMENWVRVRTCRGHDLDVVGLAWAPDDSHLASCSLDRDTPIAIWKLSATLPGVGGYDPASAARGGSSQILQPYKILGRNVHRSVVKGVSWDPVGKYLCSSGDDPAICVWRTSGDWGLEARVDSSSGIFPSRGGGAAAGRKAAAPGQQNGGMHRQGHDGDADDDPADPWDGTGPAAAQAATEELANLSLFRRISFAPDGSHICGTNASLRGKNIAAVISREGWAVSGPGNKGGGPPGAASLVGHKQPVVSSSHCPVLLSKRRWRKRRGGRDDGSDDGGGDGDDGGRSSSDDDEDVEPSFSVLVALGDKRGFVTVWSKEESRPLFKLQCSDRSRCTITDLSWLCTGAASGTPPVIAAGGGKNPQNPPAASEEAQFTLLVSMLDGHVAAIRFSPDEVGTPLSLEKRRRFFRLRYGVEIGDAKAGGGGYHVGSTGPTLVENALQYALEEDLAAAERRPSAARPSAKRPPPAPTSPPRPTKKPATAGSGTRAQQVVSRSKISGKKRIRPVLVSMDGNDGGDGGASASVRDGVSAVGGGDSAAEGGRVLADGEDGGGGTSRTVQGDAADTPPGGALNVAERAALEAERLSAKQRRRHQAHHERHRGVGATTGSPPPGAGGVGGGGGGAHSNHPSFAPPAGDVGVVASLPAEHNVIPLSKNNIFSVELASTAVSGEVARRNGLKSAVVANGHLASGAPASTSRKGAVVVADCANTASTGPGGAPARATLSISRNGTVQWKDAILGRCTALSSCSRFLVMGTLDGTLYLYGTCSTTGFSSGFAFRCCPPLVLGSSISAIYLMDGQPSGEKRDPGFLHKTEMLVICSDASFFVYDVTCMKLLYRGSVLPALNHMRLASGNTQYPKLARAQLTDSGLAIVLSLHRAVGGSLQAFMYSRDMEVWQRMADGRFSLSEYCSNHSTSKRGGRANSSPFLEGADADGASGVLFELEGLVNLEGRAGLSSGTVYGEIGSEDRVKSIATRAHCEDRMACSLALRSPSEFSHWLQLYARQLSRDGDEKHLRFLYDMLMGDDVDEVCGTTVQVNAISEDCLKSRGPNTWLGMWKALGLKRDDLVEILIQEMGKNRELQRLTSEIAMERDSR